MADYDYDFIIVGSGFGGSAAGLRLVERGYRVLMLEKGRALEGPDFAKSNWDLKRWMWVPRFGFRGIFKMTFFRHVTVLSGVGVGGGSLTYACTHPVPKEDFFDAPSWAHLADWKRELEPHYAEAKRMLGVTPVPFRTRPDNALRAVAQRRGQPDAFHPTDVAVYFGEPGVTVPDPYHGGKGPDRTGCIRCGGCMTGCRYNAKNSLDKNYLYLAKSQGMRLQADTEVTAVRALPEGGYQVEAKHGLGIGRERQSFTAKNVVMAGGVLGTVDLLLAMQEDPRGLPALSKRLGCDVRTNSEALIGVITPRAREDLSKGVAIGSIYQCDDSSHMEPVRYSSGSGFFRLLMAPHVGGKNPVVRLARLASIVLRKPLTVLRALSVPDLSKKTVILLYMRTAEGILRLRRAWHGGLTTARQEGPAPTASMPEATELAHQYADEIDGMPFSLATETLFNIPTTAHILGGCPMGANADEGVIGPDHQVHGYPGLYVMDGAAVSANPGVNPSLTITAMAERACAAIPARAQRGREPSAAAG